MNNPLGGFGSDNDNSFEQGNPVQQGVKKAAQAVGGQVAKQSKQATQDIVSQLFGADFSKSDQDRSGQTQKQQTPASSSTAQQLQQMQQKQQQPEFPGIQTDADRAKYADLTQQLGVEKQKEQAQKQGGGALQKAHMQSYYDPYIGTLETELKRLRQRKQQEEEQKKQQEAQKKEEKKMELQQEKKKEEDIAVQRAKRNTEVKQGGAG